MNEPKKTTISMKMARATEADMDAANRLANLLGEVDKGYYPSAPAADEKADEPLWFNPDDPEQLRDFYDRVMAHVKAAPGGLFRVTFGFSTLMHNNVCDPALDVLEFHPRILAALAAVGEPLALPADNQALPMAPLDQANMDLIARVFKEFRKNSCVPGDDRISESFIKAGRQLLGAFPANAQAAHSDQIGERDLFGEVPAAQVPEFVSIEGLRAALLEPREIVRDAEGWLTHPALPVCDEGTRFDKFLEAFGIEPMFVSLESDNSAFYDKWCEEGLSDCSSWIPTPPTGDGWLLLEIYATEDGVCAAFGRDWYQEEKVRKQAERAERRDANRTRAASTPQDKT